MFLRYRANTDLVLRGISLKVEAGTNVGIVGRTGAGKSTLGLAISRIMELEKGSISVDGVDISTLSLDFLREKITVIPQDPVLFQGTLRFNLDPSMKIEDEKMLDIVTKAGLTSML